MESLTIVAVDDDPADLEILARLLRAMPDVHVDLHTCNSAAEFRQRVQVVPDLLFLDYMIGEETALSVLGFFREALPNTPIIVLTGRGDESVAVEVMKAGAADYLPKSVMSSKNLARAITNAVEKAELHTQVRDYQSHLAKTNSDLIRRNEEIQSFYHVVSHELKTPLTSIREFTQILLDGLAGEMTETQNEYLHIVKESCDQLVAHMNDLLDVTRMETGKLSLRRGPLDAGELVRRIMKSIEFSARAHELELVADVADELPEINADEGRIRQVITNLLNNAFKFTPEGGRVEVRVARDPEDRDHVRFDVQDTGRGIPREHLERIFDRLYQIRQEDTGLEGGLGIGLNLSRQLVELHGGKIWVESVPDRGSTFSFKLPTAPVAALSGSTA